MDFMQTENRYTPRCFPFLSRSHLARAEDSTSDCIDYYYHGRDAFFAAAHCRHFYYHTVKTVLAYDAWLLPYDTVAIGIRFSGTGIRCRVTSIRYSATGIRFSFHRIPVTHGKQRICGYEGTPKGPSRIRCLPGNTVKSGLKAKKVTTPTSYQS